MSDQKDNAAVLELLASRICHDIISPVGAINNGIELMRELGPDGLEDGLDLVEYSASQSAAKLTAFRMAYGAGGRDPNIKPEDVQKVFGDLIRQEGKISQTWDPYGKLGPDPLPPAYCKMLMCSMMLAMECLPKGGYISVRPHKDKNGGDNASLIMAEGEGATIREQIEDALQQKVSPNDLDPRLVHPYAISIMAESYGYELHLKSRTDERIEWILECPENQNSDDNLESDEKNG
ncbi:MAG: histidine phosphotransferase family protein [Pseudomonadota bacterium]